MRRDAANKPSFIVTFVALRASCQEAKLIKKAASCLVIYFF